MITLSLSLYTTMVSQSTQIPTGSETRLLREPTRQMSASLMQSVTIRALVELVIVVLVAMAALRASDHSAIVRVP